MVLSKRLLCLGSFFQCVNTVTFLNRLTSLPTAAIVPAPSVPSTYGNVGLIPVISTNPPSRSYGSHAPTPAASTRIRTSCASIWGMGKFCVFSARVRQTYRERRPALFALLLVMFVSWFYGHRLSTNVQGIAPIHLVSGMIESPSKRDAFATNFPKIIPPE
jgi:hypothetical protein